MKNSATIDQIQYLFTFPFKDSDWKRKFLIGFLLYTAGFIIPVIPWLFFAGYVSLIIKMSIAGEDLSLPEWQDWGELLVKGLRLAGVSLIAILPMILLFGCGYLTIMAPAFLSSFGNTSSAYGSDSILLFISFFGTFGGMCVMGLSTIFGLIIGLLIPPVIGHVVAEDQFSAAFRVGEWWQIFKANLGGYLISYILLMGTTFLLTFAFQLLYLTFILCCLIPFVMSLASVYIGIFVGALFGQAYRIGKENSKLSLLPEEIAVDEGIA